MYKKEPPFSEVRRIKKCKTKQEVKKMLFAGIIVGAGLLAIVGVGSYYDDEFWGF